jgi:uncharacterized low-complexity protein
MNASKKALVLMVGSAFAAGTFAIAAHAAGNPFSAKALASGYMVADASDSMKAKDGKCATGKCGANKKATKNKMDKAKEGTCSAEKMKDGSCSAEMKASAEKAKEGTCSAEKMKEGSCHHDKN